MKITIELKLKAADDKDITNGTSNDVRFKKIQSFKGCEFVPEISGLTFVTKTQEISLYYDKKTYSVNVIDDETAEVTCEYNDLNEDCIIDLHYDGIDELKLDEILKDTIRIEPMYVTLDIKNKDIFTGDFDYLLKDVDISGFHVSENIIDYYNRCQTES